ncbi:MAG: MFS transporter [Acidobacteria bacterium]|nr:MFS transporter [Acidobacteriota bacterium]
MMVLRVQLGFALLMATFALSRYLPLSYAALFLAGLCLMTMFASITSLVQLNVSEEMRGRVMSVFMVAYRGGMPLGSLMVGFLAERFTPTTALLIVGGLLASTAVGVLASASPLKRL